MLFGCAGGKPLDALLAGKQYRLLSKQPCAFLHIKFQQPERDCLGATWEGEVAVFAY